MDVDGHLYRALNPIYARAPLSGAGAQLYDGRFNLKEMALYASLSIHTVIREANQTGTLQPTALVAYQAQISNVFDSCDAHALAPYGMTASRLADDSWRDQMKVRDKSALQEFAKRLVAEGLKGLLV